MLRTQIFVQVVEVVLGSGQGRVDLSARLYSSLAEEDGAPERKRERESESERGERRGERSPPSLARKERGS